MKDAVDEEIVKKVNRVAHHSDGDDPAIREEFAQDWSGQDGKESENKGKGFEVE